MKKIPTLFVRQFEAHNIKSVLPEVTKGLEYILEDENVIATVKWDGSCCALIGGKFYRRYDAKRGKTPPTDAIPCGEADPVTGHWPHWIEVQESSPSDKWYIEAFKNTFASLPSVCQFSVCDGTFEAIGPHFQNNPYGLTKDVLVRHGKKEIFNLDRSFTGIKEYLRCHNIEGIVFWCDGEPKCKIKRTDFGFAWPMYS